MRVLLVTNTWPDRSFGGRQQLCELNRPALEGHYGERLEVVELPRRRLRGLRQIAGAFKGHMDGLDDAAIHSVIEAIRTQKVNKLVVDGSNLGALVKAVRQQLPPVEISTLFHNVEARFFLGMLRHEKSPHALAMLAANYLAERKTVDFSHKLICLSERDSALLRKTYGRGATHVSAIAVQDKRPSGFTAPAGSLEKFALFVGGAFYANREGIRWFVERVAPRIAIKVCIVGRSMEELRPELERTPNVAVAGAMENLADWYRRAQFVIAPIFDGSGMKTKVAEALMFGKRVVGTSEAFSGYGDVAARAGWVCDTADQFVSAIREAAETVTQSHEPGLRALYEDRYSLAAAQLRLGRILDEVPARS